MGAFNECAAEVDGLIQEDEFVTNFQIASGLKSCVWLLLGAVIGVAGCAQPKVDLPAGATIEVALQEALKARVTKDPVAFIREVHGEASKVKEFTAVFLRQERLGVFKELAPQETILAEYRDEPFSVRFTWLDKGSEYKQCVYVRGRDEDKVVLLPRKGLLGFPPAVQKFAPQLAVEFGKARNPITDFGPRRMLERVLDGIEKSIELGGAKLAVREPTEIGPAKEPCYHIEIRYPKGKGVTVALQDLYLSTATLMPVGTYLWRAGREERSEDTLDAMYLYTQIDSSVRLTDANFQIDKEGKPTRKPNGIKTAALTELEDEEGDDAAADDVGGSVGGFDGSGDKDKVGAPDSTDLPER